MQLMAIVTNVGFNGDGTVLVNLALSQIDGRTSVGEATIANPGTAGAFASAVKQVARDLAEAEWGLVVSNANTLVIGE